MPHRAPRVPPARSGRLHRYQLHDPGPRGDQLHQGGEDLGHAAGNPLQVGQPFLIFQNFFKILL